MAILAIIFHNWGLLNYLNIVFFLWNCCHVSACLLSVYSQPYSQDKETQKPIRKGHSNKLLHGLARYLKQGPSYCKKKIYHSALKEEKNNKPKILFSTVAKLTES